MSLTTPSGETLSAQEDLFGRGDGKGAGIYRFALPGSALERGGKYVLLVLTTRGEALRAETSVPAGSVAGVASSRVFDRASDTVVIEWPATAGARSYFVRIETPFGPRSFFTNDTRVRLTGDVRNIEVAGLPRVAADGEVVGHHFVGDAVRNADGDERAQEIRDVAAGDLVDDRVFPRVGWQVRDRLLRGRQLER